VVFLGLLHLDVFKQRLEQEYGLSIIVTSPTVEYHLILPGNKELIIENPSDFPDGKKIEEVLEPYIDATIIVPKKYLGQVFSLCQEKRGEQLELNYLDENRVIVRYKLPLNEVVTDFYDKLKSLTSGYASFDYEMAGYSASDLVKLSILINGSPVDALATIVHRSKAYQVGRELVERLRKVIPRHLFEVVIQAAVGSKVIARSSVAALRKNVTAKCYGGDITRKRKLLEKQKEGKKRMKKFGKVDLPQEAFLTVLKKE